MRRRLIGRVVGSLGLLVVAALGLWQCAQDEIAGSTPSGLQFALSLHEPLASLVDSVEIELTRSGESQGADTVAAVGGVFSATLVATTGDGYAVAIYGKGLGGALEPGAMARGVVAYGAARGITLRPGRVTDVDLDLHPAEGHVLQVQGAAGYDTLRVRWNVVAGASRYTLAWHSGEVGTAGSHGDIADTVITLTWGETGLDMPIAGATDSVYFRVRPEFGPRRGVYGPDLLVDLSSWVDLPTLTFLYPGNGLTVEHDTASVWLGFDRPMDLASLVEGVIWNDITGGGAVKYTLEELAPSGSRYRLVPLQGELGYSRQYQVLILTTVTDTLGRRFDASRDSAGLQAAGVRWLTAAYSPLRVLTVLPPAGAGDVDPAAPVRLILNRPVDAATLSDTTCFVTDPLGASLPGSADTAATADTIVWVPDPQLWYETQYTVHATPGLRDRRGRPLDDDPETYPELEPFTSFFTTEAQPPGPIVTSVVPADGARAVATTARVRLTFSEPMNPATVRVPETFKVLQNGIAARQGTLEVDASQKVFTFTPHAPFDLSMRYVVVADSGITNLAGVRLDQDRDHPGYDEFRSYFYTEGPLSVIASVPIEGAQRVDREAQIQLTFSDRVDPATIDAASVRLLRGTAAVACGRALAQDSLALTVTPEEALAYLTTYRLVADTLVAAADGSRLDQIPAQAGKQPFELTFTTEPESINPRVTLVAPADSAVEVDLDVEPAITFSEPVEPSSVRLNTYYLVHVLGPQQTEPVAGTVSLAADSLSATFSPQAALLNGGVYELRATSLITSRFGFRLDQNPAVAGYQDFTSTFTCVPERVAPRVSDSHPRNNTSGNSTTDPVQVLFSEPMDAASVAASFSLSTSGVAVNGTGSLDATGELWTFTLAETLEWSTDYTIAVDTTATDTAGNALDQNAVMPGRQAFQATFTTASDSVGPRVLGMDPPSGSAGAGVAPTDTLRVTLSEALAPASVTPAAFRVTGPGGGAVAGQARLSMGGRVIAWTPDDSLAFATLYTVTADTLLADLAGNGLDQLPATAGRQPFTGTFTTQLESVAPRVVRSRPAAGALGVLVGSAIEVCFSEALQPATVPAAFHLTCGGAPVPGTGALGAGDTLWTFVPDRPLAFSATCTIQVDTTALDLSGNLLDQDPGEPHAQPFTSGFTTEADAYAPRAVAMDPDSGSTSVGVLDTLRITFDEPLAPGSVSAASLRVELAGGGVVAGGAWLEENDTVAAWAPEDSLAFSTEYVLVADTLLTDVAGNGLDQDPGTPGRQPFAGPFRTRIENIPPRVRASEPAGGATGIGVGAVVTLEFSEPMAAGSVADAFALRTGGSEVVGDGALDPGGTIWTFAPADSLERSALYEVFVDTTAVDLVGNGLDQDPAQAHRQPFAISFSTELDTLAPRVTATEPADGALDVDVDLETVRLEFSERLAAATVTGAAVTVAPEGGQVLAGDVELVEGDTVVVWSAPGPLDFSTRYQVTADTTLADRVGNRLDDDPLTAGRQPFVGFFTTMAENIPPVVTDVTPASPWPLDVHPTVFFSEPMDSLSLRVPDAVQLRTSGGGAVPFTLTIAPTADQVTLVPEAPLASASSYMLWVTSAATDTLGNALDQNPSAPGSQWYMGDFWTVE